MQLKEVTQPRSLSSNWVATQATFINPDIEVVLVPLSEDRMPPGFFPIGAQHWVASAVASQNYRVLTDALKDYRSQE